MKISECRNCKSKKIVKIFSLGDIYYTGKFSQKNITPRKGPINVVFCKKCTLVQLGNNFDLKYLYGPDYGYRTGINKTMTLHVKNVVKIASKISKLKNGDHVLDIASNDGTLLKFYKNGIQTFGIDPIINKFKKNYKNITYKVANFFSAKEVQKQIRNKFKIITALSVFYDLKDPNKFLKDVEFLLEDLGIAIIELADLGSIIKYNIFDTFCHEHLEYYNVKVIKEMAYKNGLKLVDIKSNDINGGSLQFYLCKIDSDYRTNHKNIKKFLKLEKKLKLYKKETFTKFINKIKVIKNNITNLIKNIKKQGKTIHGYGASTKGNVLLQYFNLSNKEIDYIADKNPNKYGLYTPGSKIKIVSEKSSRKLKPDYFLVLPWHFKKEILVREKEIRKKNTKFIFPLPNLNIV